jgi:DNA-binding transcriptional MocR family regulator
VIHVEDWAEIRRLHRAEGSSARAVARHLGISRNTVLRAPKGSAVDAVEPARRCGQGHARGVPPPPGGHAGAAQAAASSTVDVKERELSSSDRMFTLIQCGADQEET